MQTIIREPFLKRIGIEVKELMSIFVFSGFSGQIESFSDAHLVSRILGKFSSWLLSGSISPLPILPVLVLNLHSFLHKQTLIFPIPGFIPVTPSLTTTIISFSGFRSHVSTGVV